MGLGEFVRDAKEAGLLFKFYRKVRSEVAMGHGKAVLTGLAATVGTAGLAAVTAKVNEACPCFMEILKAWPVYLGAGAMAIVALYLNPPVSKK